MEQDLALAETNYAVMKTGNRGRGTRATAEPETHIERCLSDTQDDLFRKFQLPGRGGGGICRCAKAHEEFIEEEHNTRGSFITIPSLKSSTRSPKYDGEL